jgi:hypothetical protein
MIQVIEVPIATSKYDNVYNRLFSVWCQFIQHQTKFVGINRLVTYSSDDPAYAPWGPIVRISLFERSAANVMSMS